MSKHVPHVPHVSVTWDEDIDELRALCPFCGDDSYDNLQWTDYVSHPMLWCDGCGATSVIDMTLDEMEDVNLTAPYLKGSVR